MAFEKVTEVSALSDDVPLRTEVAGVPVAVVKHGEEIFAVHDTCSHQEYSLSEGMVFDCKLECALHGSMFDLRTGSPDSLPATTAIPVFAARIDGDAVLVDVSRQTNDAPFPEH